MSCRVQQPCHPAFFRSALESRTIDGWALALLVSVYTLSGMSETMTESRGRAIRDGMKNCHHVRPHRAGAMGWRDAGRRGVDQERPSRGVTMPGRQPAPPRRPHSGWPDKCTRCGGEHHHTECPDKRPLGRPPLPSGTTRVSIHVRLPPETLARLRALAAGWGVGVTGAIEMLIERVEK